MIERNRGLAGPTDKPTPAAVRQDQDQDPSAENPGGDSRSAGGVGLWGVLAVGAAAATVMVLMIAAMWRQFARPNAPAMPVGDDANIAALSHRARPALLAAAVAALPEPAAARRVLDSGSASDRVAAMEWAAGAMVRGDAPDVATGVEPLLRIVLGCPAASAPVQDAAVTGLAKRLAAAGPEALVGQGPPAKALAMLAETVLLVPAPPDLADANAAAALLDRCRRAWRQSKENAPDDPVNDPARLAEAIAAGGSLVVYARRADAQRLDAVAAELAGAASDPARPGSSRAMAALEVAAEGRGVQPRTVEMARLALAEVVRFAADELTARRARWALADAMALPSGEPLRAMALAAPGQRAAAADALRKAIRGEPAPPAPTTRPRRELAPGAMNAVLAFGVRRTWSESSADRALLTDLTTTTLAVAAMCEKLTLPTTALQRELESVLAQPDPAARARRLTRGVTMDDRAVAEVIVTPLGLDKAVADKLRKALRGKSEAEKLRAIERLCLLGGPDAGELLIEKLGEIARATDLSEFAIANRILSALKDIDDPRVPTKLAELIAPARRNALANCIVVTLMEGTGLAGSTDHINYVLPRTHTSAQRKIAASNWLNAAPTLGWGPKQMDRALGGSKPVQVAWRPDTENEKLLATFVHYAGVAGALLGGKAPSATTAPAGLAGGASPAGAGRTGSDLSAPITSNELALAGESLATQLVRMARAGDADGTRRAELDRMERVARGRLAACRTAMQAAAVWLDLSAGAMEALIRQADDSPATAQTLTNLRVAHDEVVAATNNVLDELREVAFHNLVLAEQLAGREKE